MAGRHLCAQLSRAFSTSGGATAQLVKPPVAVFGTEGRYAAALFSAAGYTTFVCGPGNIEQAHTADEWVALDQLATAAAFFQRLIEGGAR